MKKSVSLDEILVRYYEDCADTQLSSKLADGTAQLLAIDRSTRVLLVNDLATVDIYELDSGGDLLAAVASRPQDFINFVSLGEETLTSLVNMLTPRIRFAIKMIGQST